MNKKVENNQNSTKKFGKIHVFKWHRFWIKFVFLFGASFLALYGFTNIAAGLYFEKVAESYTEPNPNFGSKGRLGSDRDNIDKVFDTSLWSQEGIYLDGNNEFKVANQTLYDKYFVHQRVPGAHNNMLSVYTIKNHTDPNTTNWMIFQHGISSDWASVLTTSQAWLRSGYNVLLFDAQAVDANVKDSLGNYGSTGANGSKIASFGYYEQDDLHALVKWLANGGNNKSLKVDQIGMYGISMGAASLLLYLGRYGNEDMANNKLHFAIADSGYASLKQEFYDVAQSTYSVPPFLVYPGARFWWRLFNGYDINTINPITNLHKVKVPTMIVQGTNDTFVPYVHNFKKIYQALSSLSAYDPTHHADKAAVRLYGATHADHVTWNYFAALNAHVPYYDGPFFQPMLNWTALHFANNN